MIAGSTNAEKTSVLTALLQRGYRLVCDDYAVLHLEEARVLSLPVGVTVTDATFARFPGLEQLKRESCKFWCERQWEWTVNLADIYTVAPAFAPFVPTHFYFTSPDFSNASELDRCPLDEAMWCFQSGYMDSLPFIVPFGEQPPAYRVRCLKLARNLASNAHFFRLINGDVEQSVDLIAEAFEGGG